MHLDFLSCTAIFATGIAMGIINILAGGGSVLSIPMLIFIGVSPTEANGTNRIAILLQNASALWGFAKQGIWVFREARILIIPSLIGAFIGANIGVSISDSLLRHSLAVIIPLALGASFLKKREKRAETFNKPLLMFVFFCVGIYGGFIQAGVGFIIILALTSFTNFDLIRINAIKVTVVFFYTIIAVTTFAIGGKIKWLPAIYLSCGAMIGGWLGSYANVKINEKWIKGFILALGIVFSLRLLFSS